MLWLLIKNTLEELSFNTNSFKTLLDFLGKAVDVTVGGVEDAVDTIRYE